jgi:hypothetical protein
LKVKSRCSPCFNCLYRRPPNCPSPVCSLRFRPSVQANQGLTCCKCQTWAARW